MSDVDIHLLPSSKIIQSALAVQMICDDQGRRLSVRRMTVLDKLRLFKAAGPALAQNGPWLGVALLACSVIAIDDIPIPMPASEQQIETLVARLGDSGVAAAATALTATSEPTHAEMRQEAGN